MNLRDVTKRGFDFTLSAALLVLLTPIWLIVVLATLLADGWPAFFRQTRVGRGAVPFAMWKFRTMVRDAALRGGYQTHAGDPRVTRLGRILRRTSLDELPQLINVLTGDMSLVGPRPDTPAQKANYSDEDWQRRCSVRPGITGYAQVLHKSGQRDRDRTELDLEYVARRNLMLDLWILMKTAMIVIRARND